MSVRWPRVITAAVTLLVTSAGLSAQENSAFDPQPVLESAATMPALWLAPPAALPPTLVPPALNPDAPVAVQDGEPLVPVLFGIFGGIAGMFVGDWWADRNCGDSCGQTNIAALFLGGALGAMIGWLIGGGDIPENSPPGRWP